MINVQNTDDNQSFKWCFVRHLKTLGEKHYVLINDFSCIIIHYIVEKNLLKTRYCLHALITEEILKRYIKECFKINAKQTIKMLKRGEYVKLKHFDKK